MSFKRCYTCVDFFWFLLYRPSRKAEASLGFLIRFVFHGEDFSSFSCFLFTLINTSFVSNQKQKKKLFDKFFLLVFKLSRLLIHVFMTFLMKLVFIKKIIVYKISKTYFC